VRFVPLLLVALPAAAQVLHEPVTVGTLRCSGGVCVSGDRHDGNGVRAIEEDGHVLHEPGEPAEAKPGEQVFTPQPPVPVEVGGSGGAGGGGDAPPDRRDIIRTDRDTGPEGDEPHVYHMVFNPEPYPYKRMTALDDVRIQPCRIPQPGCNDEVLVVHDTEKHQLAVTGPTPERGRDLFWGSIVIDFEPGRLVPIPSVAADSSILQARTEPPVPVTFFKDGADNYFVRSTAGGRHRLIWLSDAPRVYFGGPLPDDVLIEDEPRELRRKLPARLRERTDRVLAHIGVKATRRSTLESVLDPLVNYFRAFEVGDLPPPTGSSYCDLALAQKGCCRHRSYAFAITAMAAGIPVRYVENELHVYVEVYVPRLGPDGTGLWRRINLGGAAIHEQLVGGEGKTLYAEKGGDPFPQPPAFAKGAEPPVGLPPGGTTGGGANGSANASGNANGDGNANGNANANGKASAAANAGAGGPSSARSDGKRVDLAVLDAQAAREGASAQQGKPKRVATRITVEALSGRGTFRGESVDVSGAVRVDGGDGGGLPVEIYLDGPHGAVRVGETSTEPSGHWHTAVEVPKELELGDHRVVARTRGDDKRAPSSSRAP